MNTTTSDNTAPTTVVTTDEHFGGCPHCGKTNGYRNAGKTHWAFCDEHRVLWHNRHQPVQLLATAAWHRSQAKVHTAMAEALEREHGIDPLEVAKQVAAAIESRHNASAHDDDIPW